MVSESELAWSRLKKAPPRLSMPAIRVSLGLMPICFSPGPPVLSCQLRLWYRTESSHDLHEKRGSIGTHLAVTYSSMLMMRRLV